MVDPIKIPTFFQIKLGDDVILVQCPFKYIGHSICKWILKLTTSPATGPATSCRSQHAQAQAYDFKLVPMVTVLLLSTVPWHHIGSSWCYEPTKKFIHKSSVFECMNLMKIAQNYVQVYLYLNYLLLVLQNGVFFFFFSFFFFFFLFVASWKALFH